MISVPWHLTCHLSSFFHLCVWARLYGKCWHVVRAWFVLFRCSAFLARKKERRTTYDAQLTTHVARTSTAVERTILQGGNEMQTPHASWNANNWAATLSYRLSIPSMMPDVSTIRVKDDVVRTLQHLSLSISCYLLLPLLQPRTPHTVVIQSSCFLVTQHKARNNWLY